MVTEYGLTLYTPAELSVQAYRLDGATLRGGKFPGLYLAGRTFRNVTFRQVDLEKLQLSDCTFRNTVFDNVTINFSNFSNVIFENCRFINAKFNTPKFTNVAFIGGEMTYEGEYEYAYTQTYFFYSDFTNVLFDGVRFIKTTIRVAKGSLYFKNINSVDNIDINSGLLNIRIDNCNIKDNFFVTAGKNSSAYVTNSTFIKSGLQIDGPVFIENSTVTGTLSASNYLVVKNCTLKAGIGGRGKWYFIDTRFVIDPQYPPSLSQFRGRDVQIYVLGSPEPVHLVLHEGVINLQNISLAQLRVALGNRLKLMNLKDVIIRGGNWEYMRLSGGQWENVQIYPTVDITDATIENVEGYNVTFPEGNPWTGQIAGGTPIRISDTPFTWTEIKVPTPEELGLIREWPTITGAPREK
jgi:uncharacterized protein YjbI with pentapeptide repeats